MARFTVTQEMLLVFAHEHASDPDVPEGAHSWSTQKGSFPLDTLREQRTAESLERRGYGRVHSGARMLDFVINEAGMRLVTPAMQRRVAAFLEAEGARGDAIAAEIRARQPKD